MSMLDNCSPSPGLRLRKVGFDRGICRSQHLYSCVHAMGWYDPERVARRATFRRGSVIGYAFKSWRWKEGRFKKPELQIPRLACGE